MSLRRMETICKLCGSEIRGHSRLEVRMKVEDHYSSEHPVAWNSYLNKLDKVNNEILSARKSLERHAESMIDQGDILTFSK